MPDRAAQSNQTGSLKACKECGRPVPMSRKAYCSDRCLGAQVPNKGLSPPPVVGSYEMLPAHLKKFTPSDPAECWIWQGNRAPNGYPMATSVRGYKGNPYRLIYMMMVEPVRPRWHLHHVCENGRGGCVNPHHLRPLPPGAHILMGDSPHASHGRKTHCKNGHEFTPENTMTHTNGYGRRCRTCAEEVNRRYRERHSAEERNAKRRDHYRRNRDKILATKQAYRDRTRATQREYQAAYRDRLKTRNPDG